jgi:hypothetical protein
MPGDVGRNSTRSDFRRIARELASMRDEDRRVRDELVNRGILFDGYDARMEQVHMQHAHQLDGILRAHGWPDERRFGSDAEESAWIILMHSISRPDVMRRGQRLLEVAVERGDASANRLARLEDRIRTLEGRPQRYGTIFDWDEDRNLSPLELESPADVDRWRKAVGLPPLADDVERVRREAQEHGHRPPVDPERKGIEYGDWRRRRGWR